MSPTFKPFRLVAEIMTGKSPEGTQYPSTLIPAGYQPVGEVPLELREIGSQFMGNQMDAEKILESINPKFAPRGLTPSELFDKASLLGSKVSAAKVVCQIFWEAVCSALPQGNRLSGDFIVCRDWIIAADSKSLTVLPDSKFPASHMVDSFSDVLNRIFGGNHVYDDTLTFPARSYDEPVLGLLDSGPGRQIYLMQLKCLKVINQHDPYKTMAAKVSAFKSAPFLEYQKWRHDLERLKRMVGILQQLQVLSIIESIDGVKLMEIMGSNSNAMETTCQFEIREDWEIVLVK